MKFWLVTLASTLIGGGIGWMIVHVSEGNDSDGGFAFKWYVVFPYDVVFYLMAAGCFVLLVLVLGGLQTLKKHSREAVDDELYSSAEQAVSKLFMQVTLWVFVIAVYAIEWSESHIWMIEMFIISSIVMMTIGWVLSRQVTKKMNELVQRMDESEKLQMYKAGFMAMRWMLTVLYVLLFVILLYSMFVEAQMNLMLLVGFLAILNQTFYFVAANQQTKARRVK